MCQILGIKSKRESQLEILKDSFRSDPYPSKQAKDQLAESLNISRKKIEKVFSDWRYRKLSKGDMKKSE